ncbi:hypothetical protein PG991_015492 [Apiospora marii]|uniref:Uncharacterized protein n=1 Tax=Apiospora marii TaxID=335849 RepID=A0ABR1R1W7_9PEZI
MDQISLFASLPPEEQAIVWDEVILDELPTAYYAEPIDKGDPVESVFVFKSVLKHVEDPAYRKSIVPSVSRFIATPGISSDEAKKFYDTLSGRCRTPVELRGLPHCIDAHKDLLILKGCWASSFEYMHLEGAHPLRYVGIEWSGPDFLFWDDFSTMAARDMAIGYNAITLVDLLPNLDALYVLVQPEHITNEVQRFWETEPYVSGLQEGEKIFFETFHARFLESYRNATARGAPLRFRCGNREYYELSADEIARIKGFQQVRPFIKSAWEVNSLWSEVKKEAKCLAMSWRVCR